MWAECVEVPASLLSSLLFEPVVEMTCHDRSEQGSRMMRVDVLGDFSSSERKQLKVLG